MNNIYGRNIFILAALCLIGLFLTLSFDASAQTADLDISEKQIATSEVEATKSAESSPSAFIKPLRDKLAEVVAKMRKDDQRVLAGEIVKLSEINFEVDTVFSSRERFVIDEALTKYFKITGSAIEEVKRQDLAIGQYIVVTGPNLDNVVNANEVFIDEHFETKSGRITQINLADFTFKMETFDKDELSVNIEKSTTQEILAFAGDSVSVQSGGFSKMKEGDIAHIVYGLPKINERKTQVTPTKLFIIPSAYFNK
jgi:hypothetical protein